jgi:hypothetical protein
MSKLTPVVTPQAPLQTGTPPALPGPQRAGASRKWFWPLVVAALFLQAVLAADCARQWTPTHDEYWHLPIGLRMWKSGRFDDDVINPPPVRLWAAIPLLLGGAEPGRVDARLDVGDIGDEFWTNNRDRFRMWFLSGRLMIIPLLTLTGIAIAVWSRDWYGDKGALVSVLLWACCPTALANGAIVTHDLPLAAAWTLTLLALVRFARRPSWPRALVFGAVLGLAPLLKLTGVILVPLSILLWFVLRGFGKPAQADSLTRQGETPGPAPKGVLLRWLAALSVSLVVINAGYLFRGTGESMLSLELASTQMKGVQQAAGGLPVPLPRDFVTAFDRLARDLETKHPVYLDREWSDRPFARYYAAALGYKLPISTLLLALMGITGLGWPRPGTADRRHGLLLLIAALFLPALASASPNQIGIRYVLPTLPMLCILAGQSARWLGSVRRGDWISRFVWIVVLAAPLSLRFHPHHLAYFNVLAGGPEGGRWRLVDSNLDWGQDLDGLKEYLDKHHVQDVGLAYYGTVPPVSIGTHSRRPPSRFPQPGWYVISANFLQGRPHVIRDSDGLRTQVGLDEFGYFRFFEPVTTIGYSIYVYRLSHQDIARYAQALQQSP